ncbi:hypothetical protein [Amycolatopsis sp. NPDC059657]|uniref:hypothetical protein n=1 Tax=Amycolatopsis sp. NPDC059657 TaxID=3346899 RepID=UPI00367235EB
MEPLALRRSAPPADLPNEILRTHLWRASREGVTGRCVHPETGQLTPVQQVLADLIRLTKSFLQAADDLEFAEERLARLAEDGGGADRQRQRFTQRQRAEDVIDLLARPAG